MKTVHFPTTWGTIVLTLDGDTLVQCDLPVLESEPSVPFAPIPSKLARNEMTFFWTLRRAFPTFSPACGTPFQRKVWKGLLDIPYGQVRTYGEIAEAIGHPRAARAVGSACGANPLPVFIPCHRAVSKHNIGGYSCGLPWKELLLGLEDVPKHGR